MSTISAVAPGRRGLPGYRLLTNTVAQLAGPITRAVSGLLLVAVLARYLGVAGLGEYALVVALVETFSGIFGEWGLGTIVIREISRRPTERGRILSSAALLQLTISAAAYVLLLATIWFAGFPAPVATAIAVYGLTMLVIPINILSTVFYADLMLPRLVRPSVVGVLAHVGLTLLVVQAQGPLVALVGAALTARLFQAAWVLALTLRHVAIAWPPTIHHWAYLIRESWPMAVVTTLITLGTWAPILVLSSVGPVAIGQFNAAVRIPFFIVLALAAVQTTLLPVLTRLWIGERGAFTRTLDLALTATFLTFIPGLMLLSGLARVIVTTIFGSRFDGAVLPAIVLFAAIGSLVPAMILQPGITAAGYQRLHVVVQAVALAVVGAFLLILVPRYGAVGAAGAVTAFNLAITGTTFALGRLRLGDAVPLRPLAAGAAAAAVGWTVIWVSEPESLPAASLAALLAAGVFVTLHRGGVRQLVSLALSYLAPRARDLERHRSGL